MIKLAPLNDAIPEELQNRIRNMEEQLTARELHPFAGPVIDQSGATIVPAGKNMTDEQLNKMNYYLQGVVSTIPN
jgi:simple sugar transport system substrate-binding protein